MDNRLSTFIRISEQDTISQSNELIQKLSYFIKNYCCPTCLSKLKEVAGVNQTPALTGHKTDDTQPQACNQESDIDGLYKRHK